MTSIEVVKQFYFHLASSDIQKAMMILDDDFVLTQAKSLPYGGEFRGEEGINQFFKLFFSFWKTFKSENVEYFSDGSTVFTTSVGVGTTQTGKQIEVSMVQVYEVKDGKLLTTKPFYLDTAEMLR